MRKNGAVVPFSRDTQKNSTHLASKGSMPRAEMCRDKDWSTGEREVIERWKQHFDEHLICAETVGSEFSRRQKSEREVMEEDNDDAIFEWQEQ